MLLINIHFQVEFECLKTLLLSIPEDSSVAVKWQVALTKVKEALVKVNKNILPLLKKFLLLSDIWHIHSFPSHSWS